MSASQESRRLHYELTNVGLRAQATAAGLVQLCVELQRANVLDEESVGRIKASIADEILISLPRHVVRPTFKDDLRARLDRIFRGEQELGTGDSLALPID
ncbi:hypothetical protein [Sphingomonas sp. 1P08PE]|uniref:hypothetical protein n=1 Tax=Sphingomonas sp. 1P08PE TaxID=554122 RepID=UPI0039A1D944